MNRPQPRDESDWFFDRSSLAASRPPCLTRGPGQFFTERLRTSALRVRCRHLARSSSPMPPHTPEACPVSNAQLRHCSRTGQRQHTRLAASRSSSAGPDVPTGKNNSGSSSAQAAPRHHISMTPPCVAGFHSGRALLFALSTLSPTTSSRGPPTETGGSPLAQQRGSASAAASTDHAQNRRRRSGCGPPRRQPCWAARPFRSRSGLRSILVDYAASFRRDAQPRTSA